MNGTEILLKAIMLDLLTSEDLEEAIDRIEVLLDEDQMSLVQKKAMKINEKKAKNKK